MSGGSLWASVSGVQPGGNLHLSSKINSTCISIWPSHAQFHYMQQKTSSTLPLYAQMIWLMSLHPSRWCVLLQSESVTGHRQSEEFMFSPWSLKERNINLLLCKPRLALQITLTSQQLYIPLSCSFHSFIIICILFFLFPASPTLPRFSQFPFRFSAGALGHGHGSIFTLFPPLNATSS